MKRINAIGFILVLVTAIMVCCVPAHVQDNNKTSENVNYAFYQDQVQEAEVILTQDVEVSIQDGSIIDFLKDNWIALLVGLLAFIEVVVRLTPTETDNKWFTWLKNMFDTFVPSLKKGGGIFSKKIKT